MRETPASDDGLTTAVRNHWWWRPGWRPGRHFYACHLTFEQSTALHRLVSAYRATIAGVPNLDPIPREWLHLTLRGIGFVDAVTDEELRQIRNSMAEAVATLTHPVVTFSRPVVRPEAIYLPAEPTAPLQQLHHMVGEAIDSVRGPERRHELPEQSAGYRPHVSLAYVNSDGPAEPLRELLAAAEPPPATVTITDLPLLTFHRDNRMYQWTNRDPIPIGDQAQPPPDPGP